MAETVSGVPVEARRVLETFLEASKRQDEAGMRACLDKKTLESGNFSPAGPEGMDYVLGAGQMEGELAVIPIKAIPSGSPEGTPPAMAMNAVLVREEGQWKLDLGTTMERMLGATMEQVGSAVGQMMEGMGKAIGEALEGALGGAFGGGTSETSEEEKAWEAPLPVGEEEFLPMPEMTVLAKASAAVSAALGSEVVVQAAVGELLKQLGSDDRETLVTWLDETLFGDWENVFRQAAEVVPVAGPVRAVRIEPAARCEDRVVVLDGSDIVYRMNLTHTDGYWSDADLLQMLPGLLAGLPMAIDEATAGKRLLPMDDETMGVEVYRARWVPRWMQRIRSLVGQPVGLEVDWNAAEEATNTAGELPRWGLNRVYGALKLAWLEDGMREALAGGLKKIRLAVGVSVSSRFARYEDGVLEVGLSYLGGDTPGCYEWEIARALGGEAVGERDGG